MMEFKEYYGDQVRTFIGKAIDVVPESGREGMIRIRIYGIHSGSTQDIPQVDLPWAPVLVPGTEAGVSGLGWSSQILPGALVFGIFLDGANSQLPLVLGTLPHIETPLNEDPNGPKVLHTEFAPVGVPSYTVAPDYVSTSNQSRSIAQKFFIDNGWTDSQAAGMTGTFEVISGFNAKYDDGNSIGIGKWSNVGNRKSKLISYANSKRWDVYTIELQLNFVLHEMRTAYSALAGKLKNSQWHIGNFTGSSWIFANGYTRGLDVKLVEAAAVRAYELSKGV